MRAIDGDALAAKLRESAQRLGREYEEATEEPYKSETQLQLLCVWDFLRMIDMEPTVGEGNTT